MASKNLMETNEILVASMLHVTGSHVAAADTGEALGGLMLWNMK